MIDKVLGRLHRNQDYSIVLSTVVNLHKRRITVVIVLRLVERRVNNRKG